jgi:hypothetical protein
MLPVFVVKLCQYFSIVFICETLSTVMLFVRLKLQYLFANESLKLQYLIALNPILPFTGPLQIHQYNYLVLSFRVTMQNF